MLKKISLGAALFWAAVISYLCLIRISELPEIKILYVDKILHAFFYFIFSILWFYALRFNSRKQNRTQLLIKVFLLSLLFGIAIELFQTFLTTYRSGDIIDVLANTSGTLLAFLLITTIDKNDFLSKIAR